MSLKCVVLSNYIFFCFNGCTNEDLAGLHSSSWFFRWFLFKVYGVVWVAILMSNTVTLKSNIFLVNLINEKGVCA